jgi:cysteinyl-tRNA synthetase
MAGAIFPECPIDVHAGGVDLKFPHHDNEIAQSEAYYNCNNWVNNFWHTGHLHTKGKKMSKSLKNFSTIRDMLEHYTGRQMRMLFLLHQWHTTMNYSPEESFPEAIKKEDQFAEFFKTVKATLRQCNVNETSQKWTEKDFALDAALSAKDHAVREALCDNFDTPKAIHELSELVTATNIYLSQPPTEIKIPLVRSVSRFVFHILKCFGLYDDGDFPAVVSGDAGAGASHEDAITPLMNVLLKFRDDVKKNAGTGGKELLQLSDELRDDILPHLGIRLEDKGKDAASIWKYEDKETLLKERAAKLADKAAKEQAKRERAELELKKKSTPGKDWFRTMEADKYSKFNEETGLPTHDAKDKALPEALLNKCKKTQNSQEAKYQKWLKEQETKAPAQEEKKEEA